MGDVLFLCHRIPYPPDKGDKIRAWHMLRHLSQRHRVHLGCLTDHPADLAHLPVLRAQCATVMCRPINRRRQVLHALSRWRPGRPLTVDYFHSSGLQTWVDRTRAATRLTHLFVFSSAMAPYVMREHRCQAHTVLDMVDVDSEKWNSYAQQAALPMRLIWAREARTLLAFERRAASWFDRTLFVSAAEAGRFIALAPDVADRVDWVENGVDLAYFSPKAAYENPYGDNERAIVFTGTMDYRPNIAAVIFFAQNVLPGIRARCPGATFHIVGAHPVASVRALSALPGVTVVGAVSDTRPYLAHAKLAVAPLQIARGIQNKVLEAMAMARPVLISPQALEGLRVHSGRDVLVAADALSMAAQAGAVLAGAHPGLGAAARQAVEQIYPWKTTLRRLEPLLLGQ